MLRFVTLKEAQKAIDYATGVTRDTPFACTVAVSGRPSSKPGWQGELGLAFPPSTSESL